MAIRAGRRSGHDRGRQQITGGSPQHQGQTADQGDQHHAITANNTNVIVEDSCEPGSRRAAGPKPRQIEQSGRDAEREDYATTS